jgi:hypothetical protein
VGFVGLDVLAPAPSCYPGELLKSHGLVLLKNSASMVTQWIGLRENMGASLGNDESYVQKKGGFL